MSKIKVLFYVFIFWGCSYPSMPTEPSIKRVALVIGNQHYKNNALENPINDAKGMAKTLKEIGFDVLLRFDVTKKELDEALSLFKHKIVANETIVFIYFAGHGNTLKVEEGSSQASSEEYLMMTDRKKTLLVSIYKLYDFLIKAKGRQNIVVIDACRDYQEQYRVMNKRENYQAVKNFRGNFRTISLRHDAGKQGEEEVLLDNNYASKFPPSTLVSYATMHKQKAQDWSIHDKSHSPYTYALMNYLNDEEIPIEEVFRRVRVSLLKETKRKQSNLEELNLEKNIWLVPKRAEVAVAPAF